jgi:hypothetical protein
MEHLNNTELLRQALDVNRSFDQVIWGLRQRILPTLKQGIAQPPRDGIYWQKWNLVCSKCVVRTYGVIQ